MRSVLSWKEFYPGTNWYDTVPLIPELGNPRNSIGSCTTPQFLMFSYVPHYQIAETGDWRAQRTAEQIFERIGKHNLSELLLFGAECAPEEIVSILPRYSPVVRGGIALPMSPYIHFSNQVIGGVDARRADAIECRSPICLVESEPPVARFYFPDLNATERMQSVRGEISGKSIVYAVPWPDQTL